MDGTVWVEGAKTALSALTTIAVALGAWLALQNWKLGEKNREMALKNSELTERWKRAELAASCMRPLFEDEECLFALRCIDWGVGEIPVPSRHRAMVEDREKIKHDCTLLAHAMEPTLRREIVDSPEGMLYRLALDTLFARLNWIGHRISNDLITIDDVPDLQYWMRLLARWPYAPKGIDHSDVFVPFLKSYGYDQTLNMMRLFGIPVSEAEKLARDGIGRSGSRDRA